MCGTHTQWDGGGLIKRLTCMQAATSAASFFFFTLSGAELPFPLSLQAQIGWLNSSTEGRWAPLESPDYKALCEVKRPWK